MAGGTPARVVAVGLSLTRKLVASHLVAGRLRLLPLLEKEYNANIRELLSTTAETVAADYDYLAGAAESAARSLGAPVSLKKFLALHPALRRLFLRQYIARVKGDTRRIDFRHTREIEEMLSERPAGSRVDLPQGISARKTKQTFRDFPAVTSKKYPITS